MFRTQNDPGDSMLASARMVLQSLTFIDDKLLELLHFWNLVQLHVCVFHCAPDTIKLHKPSHLKVIWQVL